MDTFFDQVKVTPQFDNLFILITNKCNIECKHCYVASSPSGDRGISLTKIEDVVLQTKEIFPKVRVVLSGGEPFTRKKDILYLLEKFGSSTPFLVLSNGMLITETLSRDLSRYANLTIRLSIDGAEAEKHDYIRGKGSFERLLKGIENLRTGGFNFSNLQFSSTVPIGFEDNVDSILDFASKLGISKIKFEPVAKTGNATNFWGEYPTTGIDLDSVEFKTRIDQKTASAQLKYSSYAINDAAFKDLTIYSNGDVYPFTFINDVDKEYGLVGNIYNHQIGELVVSKRMSEAILTKFLHYSMGPRRSLGATMFVNSHHENTG